MARLEREPQMADMFKTLNSRMTLRSTATLATQAAALTAQRGLPRTNVLPARANVVLCTAAVGLTGPRVECDDFRSERRALGARVDCALPNRLHLRLRGSGVARNARVRAA